MFRFGSPEYLYLLLLVPLLMAAYALYASRRRKRLDEFGKYDTIKQLMPLASPKRVRHKFVLTTIGITLLIFAMARPQLGAKLKEVKRTGIEIMIAVDVSNSMLAEDFTPNRLERTKYAIDRLIEQLEEDRIGVIVFAGDAYVQLPITSDYQAARNFVRNISTNMVSLQGTAMGAAIRLAVSSFSPGSEGSRVMILISDGENHEDNAVAAAQTAEENGVTIYAIGVGTPEGAPIRFGNDYIKDEDGNMVVTKLDEQTMEQIALTTGGSYIRATNGNIGLSEIIARVNEVEKKELTATVFEEYNELYQYILAAALLFFITETFMISRRNRLLARFNIFKK